MSIRVRACGIRSVFLFAMPAMLACAPDEPGGPLAAGSARQASAIERFEIEGGPKVVIVPVGGVSRVAVQAMYDVGIVDEPRGIAQASHLIEHLACMGATAKGPAGETFKMLNQIGMANAETLPSLTHYDYGLPADRFELAIETEAERLRSLKIDQKLVSDEAAKCYQEVRFVSSRTPPALGKFALMAATQAWRHSEKSARVLGGLEGVPLSELEAFRARYYHRANLTLIVTGSVSRDRVFEAVKKHFEELPSPPFKHPSTDWRKVAKQGEIRWDAPATIVYVGFPPPDDPAEQLVMTAAFQFLEQALSADPEVQALASGVDSSNMIWPVGRCPGFAAFTLKPGVKPDDARAKLTGRLRAAIPGLEAGALASALPMLAELPWSLEPAALKSQAESMARQMGSIERAYDALLGNTAIQIGLRELWLGSERKTMLERAQALAGDGLAGFVKRVFSEEKRFVTVLVPEKA